MLAFIHPALTLNHTCIRLVNFHVLVPDSDSFIKMNDFKRFSKEAH